MQQYSKKVLGKILAKSIKQNKLKTETKDSQKGTTNVAKAPSKFVGNYIADKLLGLRQRSQCLSPTQRQRQIYTSCARILSRSFIIFFL